MNPVIDDWLGLSTWEKQVEQDQEEEEEEK